MKNWLIGGASFLLVLTSLLYFSFQKHMQSERVKLRPSEPAIVAVEEPEKVDGVNVPVIPPVDPDKPDEPLIIVDHTKPKLEEIPVIDPSPDFPEPEPEPPKPKPAPPKPKPEPPKPKPTPRTVLVDYEPVLDERQDKKPRWLNMNWRRSVVDLLKLTFLPSCREERNQMADKLGYDGPDGTYERNVWLHRRMRKGLEKGEIPLGDEKTETNNWKYK